MTKRTTIAEAKGMLVQDDYRRNPSFEEVTPEYIKGRKGRFEVVIPVEHIIYCKAEDKYVVVHHEGGELLVYMPTIQLENVLGGKFVRIHRNCIVARDCIFRIIPGRGIIGVKCELTNGAVLNVSRREVHKVYEAMNVKENEYD